MTNLVFLNTSKPVQESFVIPNDKWVMLAKILHLIASLFSGGCNKWWMAKVEWASPAYYAALNPLPIVQQVKQVQTQLEAKPEKAKKPKKHKKAHKKQNQAPQSFGIGAARTSAPLAEKLSEKNVTVIESVKSSYTTADTRALEKVQEQLQELNLDEAPQFLAQLLDELNIQKRFPNLKLALNPLKNALQALLDPNAFTDEPTIANQAKLEFLGAIKALDLSQTGNGLKIRTTFEQIQANTMIRYSRHKVQARIGESIDLIINAIHAKHDQASQLVLKHYGYSNLRVIKNEYLEDSLEVFNGLCTKMEKRLGIPLQSLAPERLQILLDEIGKECLNICETSIVDDISAEIHPFIEWLSANIAYLKKPYNQGDDHSRNMGMGTCLQNSVDRIVLLGRTPTLPSAEIPMGSTERGRFLQAIVNHKNLRGEKSISAFLIEALEKVYKKASGQACELVTTDLHPLVNAPKGSKTYILDQLLVKASKMPFLGTLALTKDSSGHAITVQIDPSEGIYRLFDDNLGVLEYPWAEEFKAGVSTYLALQYRRYDKNYLLTFEPKN